MKYLRQFAIIALIALAGEALNAFLPFPVPGSIYGIVILFTLLMTGVMKVESIRDVSSFLIGIMPVMFIPAAAGMIESFGLFMPSMFAYVTITALSTVAVMAVSGRITQAFIRRKSKKEDSAA